MKKNIKPQKYRKSPARQTKKPQAPNKSGALLYLSVIYFLNMWMVKLVTLEQWGSIVLICHMKNRINTVEFCETCCEHRRILFLYNDYVSWFNNLVTCTAVYKMFKLMLQDNKQIMVLQIHNGKCTSVWINYRSLSEHQMKPLLEEKSLSISGQECVYLGAPGWSDQIKILCYIHSTGGV